MPSYQESGYHDNLPIQIKQYKIRFEKDDDDSLPTDLKFHYQLLNANISATPGSEKTHTNSRFSWMRMRMQNTERMAYLDRENLRCDKSD